MTTDNHENEQANTIDASKAERHKARQQKVKVGVDAKIAAAQDEKGILLVLTGNGKGKSTSGFGSITRAVGHGHKAAVVQFINMVLLDELTYMVSYHYIELERVLTALRNRPAMQHVIITGRACHRDIIELADTVSEVQPIKHAFNEGIKAQLGFDY